MKREKKPQASIAPSEKKPKLVFQLGLELPADPVQRARVIGSSYTEKVIEMFPDARNFVENIIVAGRYDTESLICRENAKNMMRRYNTKASSWRWYKPFIYNLRHFDCIK